jgi:type I restriction enzyme S subunit
VSGRNGNADGWVRTTLDELGTLYCGQSPPSQVVNRDGQGIVYVTGPEQWDGEQILIDKWTTEPRRMVPDGCIFVTVKDAGVGTIFPGIACAIGRDIYAYCPSESVSSAFIHHALHATIDVVKRQAKGDIPGLTKDHLLKHEIGLPPLAEQQRIVMKIEALRKRSQRIREALAEVGPLLEQFRQSVLAAAFRGDLTADWRTAHPDVEPASELLHRILTERRRQWEQAELAKYEAKGTKPPKGWQDKFEEPEPVDDSDLPELPEGWYWIRVAELASDLPRAIQSGPFGSNLLHSEFQDTGILAIGIDNVHRDGFSLGQQHRISREKYEELKQYTARALDVLVTVMATVGRCCLVPADLETAIITKHVYRITLEQRLINPHFLVLGFQGAVGVLKQLAKAIRGQTRPGINGEILKSLAIPVPPRQEQDVICEAVHNQIAGVNNISQLISETTDALDHLDQSILAKAFRGELVPQDPNDEPASALLARIREQKAQQVEAAKGTKKTTNRQRRDAMRKKLSGLSSPYQPLGEVLTTKGQPMPPEQLLTAAG